MILRSFRSVTRIWSCKCLALLISSLIFFNWDWNKVRLMLSLQNLHLAISLIPKLNLIRPNGFTRDHYLNHDRKSVTLIFQRTGEHWAADWLPASRQTSTVAHPPPHPAIPRYQTPERHNILQEALHHQISQQDHRNPPLRLRWIFQSRQFLSWGKKTCCRNKFCNLQFPIEKNMSSYWIEWMSALTSDLYVWDPSGFLNSANIGCPFGLTILKLISSSAIWPEPPSMTWYSTVRVLEAGTDSKKHSSLPGSTWTVISLSRLRARWEREARVKTILQAILHLLTVVQDQSEIKQVENRCFSK